MFTKEESESLMDFLDYSDAYDFVTDDPALRSVLDKVYDMLDTEREKCW